VVSLFSSFVSWAQMLIYLTIIPSNTGALYLFYSMKNGCSQATERC
jgi:hypothetical protein